MIDPSDFATFWLTLRKRFRRMFLQHSRHLSEAQHQRRVRLELEAELHRGLVHPARGP